MPIIFQNFGIYFWNYFSPKLPLTYGSLSSYLNPILGYKATDYTGDRYDNYMVMLAPNYNVTQSHVKIILILKFCTNRLQQLALR